MSRRRATVIHEKSLEDYLKKLEEQDKQQNKSGYVQPEIVQPIRKKAYTTEFKEHIGDYIMEPVQSINDGYTMQVEEPQQQNQQQQKLNKKQYKKMSLNSNDIENEDNDCSNSDESSSYEFQKNSQLEEEEEEKANLQPTKKSIMFIGAENVGKAELIYALFDKPDEQGKQREINKSLAKLSNEFMQNDSGDIDEIQDKQNSSNETPMNKSKSKFNLAKELQKQKISIFSGNDINDNGSELNKSPFNSQNFLNSPIQNISSNSNKNQYQQQFDFSEFNNNNSSINSNNQLQNQPQIQQQNHQSTLQNSNNQSNFYKLHNQNSNQSQQSNNNNNINNNINNNNNNNNSNSLNNSIASQNQQQNINSSQQNIRNRLRKQSSKILIHKAQQNGLFLNQSQIQQLEDTLIDDDTELDPSVHYSLFLDKRPSIKCGASLDFYSKTIQNEKQSRQENLHLWVQNLSCEDYNWLIESVYYNHIEIFILVFSYEKCGSLLQLYDCVDNFKQNNQDSYFILVGIGKINSKNKNMQNQVLKFRSQYQFDDYVEIKDFKDQKQTNKVLDAILSCEFKKKTKLEQLKNIKKMSDQIFNQQNQNLKQSQNNQQQQNVLNLQQQNEQDLIEQQNDEQQKQINQDQLSQVLNQQQQYEQKVQQIEE
ncbi:hypothetical protein PPERSA_10245 [Pseudocohnilembus persalinus]|uniref:Uncharacterized protein n=1 Tax=Pseudocohnilembus persalinus TaxID=266149 RepID=A0A0V0QM18_PSEPJ|nr:hypothetical protein PPERSA_10245 [Pseudocohnilembus persalinus]|eukprot:KRX03164.1 hypothetical protein PPERSA_10245 [Pseudocohnilembus persalinus]